MSARVCTYSNNEKVLSISLSTPETDIQDVYDHRVHRASSRQSGNVLSIFSRTDHTRDSVLPVTCRSRVG